MGFSTWQLLTVLLPRGADVAIHVIKKINSEIYFFFQLKQSENK